MSYQNKIIVFSLLIIQVVAHAGKESGGGNPYLSDFRNRGQYILSKKAQGLLSLDELIIFRESVELSQPIAASGKLIHAEKGEVIAKMVTTGHLTSEDLLSLSRTTIDWLNKQSNGMRLILIDINKWTNEVTAVANGSKTIDLLQFVFHEFLQLGDIPDSHDEISSKLRLTEASYQIWKTEQLKSE